MSVSLCRVRLAGHVLTYAILRSLACEGAIPYVAAATKDGPLSPHDGPFGNTAVLARGLVSTRGNHFQGGPCLPHPLASPSPHDARPGCSTTLLTSAHPKLPLPEQVSGPDLVVSPCNKLAAVAVAAARVMPPLRTPSLACPWTATCPRRLVVSPRTQMLVRGVPMGRGIKMRVPCALGTISQPGITSKSLYQRYHARRIRP